MDSVQKTLSQIILFLFCQNNGDECYLAEDRDTFNTPSLNKYLNQFLHVFISNRIFSERTCPGKYFVPTQNFLEFKSTVY
jgi:hypothetical protein